MRIGIDAYPLTRGTKSGIDYYTCNIIRNMLEIDKKNEFYLYADPARKIELGLKGSSPNLHFSDNTRSNPLNRSSTLWMLLNAKRSMARDKIDIFLGTENIIPPYLPDSTGSVLIVYDLTFYFYPETMKSYNYLIFKLLFKRSLENAKRIIAISQATANGINNHLNDKNISGKVSVAHGGIDLDRFRQMKKGLSLRYISDKFNISDRFILSVGTLEPRKNITGLLNAFAILKKQYGIRHQLIIVGAKGWRTSDIFKSYKQLGFNEKEVRFLGYLTEDDLVKLYSAADLFVMPSFYEGFGLPPLEAMACGTPVVASGIPIFKEILGDAALLANPYSPEDIARKIYEVLENAELGNILTDRGFKRVQLFSWRDSAEKILAVLQSMPDNIKK